MAFMNVPIRKGEIVRERVKVGEFADGVPISMPVITIGGSRSGPTAYLQAGVHGDELTGIEVCRRSLAALDPSQVIGNIVAVPIGNVPAYLTRTRGFLHEERGPIDMNRVFPGSPKGLLTERIADILFNEFLKNADYALDLHCALAGCNIFPFAYVAPADNENGTLEVREKMAQAFGTKLVYYKDRAAKLGTSNIAQSFSAQADEAGIPGIIVEMGESLQITWEFMDTGVNGTINMLRVMGNLAGEAKAASQDQRRFTKINLVHTEAGGLLHTKVALGDDVSAGQTIASVVDPLEDKTHEIKAPVDGVLLRLMTFGSCYSGAEIAWVVNSFID